MFIFQVIDAFEHARLRYAVVGGYELALQGLVRATHDIDFVLSLTEEDFKKAEKALSTIGLEPRLPLRADEIIKMRKQYIQKKKITDWSFVDFKNPMRQVDLCITRDLRKIQPIKISVFGRKISVMGLKDILKMKQGSAREQDQIDIKNIQNKLHEKN